MHQTWNFSQTTPAGSGIKATKGFYRCIIENVEDIHSTNKQGQATARCQISYRITGHPEFNDILIESIPYAADPNEPKADFAGLWMRLFGNVFNVAPEVLQQRGISGDPCQILPRREVWVYFGPKERVVKNEVVNSDGTKTIKENAYNEVHTVSHEEARKGQALLAAQTQAAQNGTGASASTAPPVAPPATPGPAIPTAPVNIPTAPTAPAWPAAPAQTWTPPAAPTAVMSPNPIPAPPPAMTPVAGAADPAQAALAALNAQLSGGASVGGGPPNFFPSQS